jgi:hypothetical protein
MKNEKEETIATYSETIQSFLEQYLSESLASRVMEDLEEHLSDMFEDATIVVSHELEANGFEDAAKFLSEQK